MIRGGQSASLPVQLSGLAPFSLEFEAIDTEKRFTLQSAHERVDISVDAAGSYRLTNVRDRVCSGTIVDGDVCVGMCRFYFPVHYLQGN